MKPSRRRVQSDIGREIRQARIAASVSQRELASRVGKAQSWVAGVESGARRLLAAELIEIASVLGANPSELLAKALGVARKGARRRGPGEGGGGGARGRS